MMTSLVFRHLIAPVKATGRVETAKAPPQVFPEGIV